MGWKTGLDFVSRQKQGIQRVTKMIRRMKVWSKRKTHHPCT
jgi:hypothetical protein